MGGDRGAERIAEALKEPGAAMELQELKLLEPAVQTVLTERREAAQAAEDADKAASAPARTGVVQVD